MSSMKRWFAGRYGCKPISIGCFIFAGLFLAWGLVWGLVIRPGGFRIFGPLSSAALLAAMGVWRCLSRNTAARAREDYAAKLLWQQLRYKMKNRSARRGKTPRKDPNTVYTTQNAPNGSVGYAVFGCPVCGQSVRVPAGKGKLRVTCPKCKHVFEQKT